MIETKNIGILVKFVEQKYVQKFMNEGEIHFSSLQYFIDLEKNNGNHVIGDKNEGEYSYTYGPGTRVTIMPLGKDGKPNGEEFTFSPSSSEFREGLYEKDKETIGVSSFIYLSLLNDYQLIKRDSENKVNYYLLKPETLKWLKEFNEGNRQMIAIYDYFKFLKMANSKRISHKLVEYYDNNLSDIKKHRNYYDYVFLKRKSYKDQREFRLAVRLKKSLTSENIQIGSINSFAKVFNYDEIGHLGLIVGTQFYNEE